MTNESDIERFFAAYSIKERKWVEKSSEYQIAVKLGETTAAPEIAAVVISYFHSPNYRQMKRDMALILKKEFPEIDIPN